MSRTLTVDGYVHLPAEARSVIDAWLLAHGHDPGDVTRVHEDRAQVRVHYRAKSYAEVGHEVVFGVDDPSYPFPWPPTEEA